MRRRRKEREKKSIKDYLYLHTKIFLFTGTHSILQCFYLEISRMMHTFHIFSKL